MSSTFDFQTALLTTIALPIVYLVLKRVGRFLRSYASQITDGLLYIVGRVARPTLLASINLRRYCSAALQRPGPRYLLVPGRSAVTLPTDRVYVALDFRGPAGESRKFNSFEILKPGSRSQIIGDPGSGKSTYLKKLFRDSCKIGWQLPILLELRTLPKKPSNATTDDALGNWILRELKKRVSSVSGFNMDALFDTITEERGVIVLLDGLDEVGTNSFDEVLRGLRSASAKLSSRSAENIIVVSMRTQFRQQIANHLDDEFPSVYHVRPFSPEETFEFLQNWPFAVSDAKAEQLRIFSDLSERPTLREMCSTPLVLAMYVANDQGSEGQVRGSDTRTEFYSQVVEELLVMRRNRQVGIESRTALRRQLEHLLGRLAWENLLDHNQAANNLSWSRGVQAVQELLQIDNAGDASTRFRQIARDTGIISEEREGETFRFIHLTFCEFLAARFLGQVEREGVVRLLDAHEAFAQSDSPQLHSRLLEVVPFALAHVAPVGQEDLIVRIWRLRDIATMARCFLETQHYDNSIWSEYVTAHAKKISERLSAMPTEDWLGSVRLFQVVISDQAKWASLFNRASSYPALESLFLNLMQRDRIRLSRLIIETAGAHDPALAFRLSKLMHIDLVLEHPEVVSSNLSNPAFALMAFDQFKRNTPESEVLNQWIYIFAHAGLGDARLSQEIADNIDFATVAEKTDQLPNNQRWNIIQREPVWNRTPYSRYWTPSSFTRALDFTLNQDIARIPVEFHERLAPFKEVPPPQSLLPSYIFKIASAMAVVAGLVLCEVTINFSGVTTNQPWFFFPIVALFGLVTIATTVTVWSYGVLRDMIYREALAIDYFDLRAQSIGSLNYGLRLAKRLNPTIYQVGYDFNRYGYTNNQRN